MDMYESEIVLDIGLRLARLALERGHDVVMTRDGDYYLNDEERVDHNGDGNVDRMDQLQQRVDIFNAAGVDLFVSLHLNSYAGEDANEVGGVASYYCAARPFSDKTLLLAELIQQHTLTALAELGYEAKDRGVRTDFEAGTPDEHLILLGPEDEDCARASDMPGALSESLFITNDFEAELLTLANVRERIAWALLAAIEAYAREVGDRGPIG